MAPRPTTEGTRSHTENGRIWRDEAKSTARAVARQTWSLTNHAGVRLRQRGLRETDIDLVMACGTDAPGGRVILRRRDVAREIAACKRRIQTLERLSGCTVVCEEDAIVTCYHATGHLGRKVLKSGGLGKHR